MLSDLPCRVEGGAVPVCLNAPFGAQCFPTGGLPRHTRPIQVSMHLLVLSAFRPEATGNLNAIAGGSQCTFWCSVLSDGGTVEPDAAISCLNAPFGAQCFPTQKVFFDYDQAKTVSMHLLVLSAFRRHRVDSRLGAGNLVSMHLLVLSAFRL